MIAVIQGVPSRNRVIQKIKKNLSGYVDVHIHLDCFMNGGAFYPFIEMLEKFPRDQYRLHMQDDIELCEDFGEALPYFENLVKEQGIDFLSLYAPKRMHFKNELEIRGGNIITEFNSVWIQCCIMSPRLLELLYQESEDYIKQYRSGNPLKIPSAGDYPKDDDTFIVGIMQKYKIKGYCFLPSLSQHLVGEGSLLGHANSDTRTSDMYDKNYLRKLKSNGLKFW